MHPMTRRRQTHALVTRPVASDACSRCSGKGEIPRTPGDYSVMVRCPKCHGTGRRGG